MGDIYIGRNEDGELTHSARGTTWSKDGASYISRKKVNGKWVYTYGKPGHIVSTRSGRLSRRGGRGFTELDEGRYSNYESLKRQSVSAQRNIKKDPRYKVEAKTAYLKNKASRAARKNIAKGKARVNAILERLRESAAAARTEYNKKARAARTQATIKKTQAERAAAEKRRKEANRKKYAAQAKAQKHTKRVIAREQAVGKVKRTAKAAKSYVTKGWGTGYAGRKEKVRSVSKKVNKKNAGKKR